MCECSTEHILFNKTDFVIGNCLNDGLFALVISSMILPHDKIGLNEGQERYRGVVRGCQRLLEEPKNFV